jgi:hypothetical protein
MDNLGVPPFQETSICDSLECVCTICTPRWTKFDVCSWHSGQGCISWAEYGSARRCLWRDTSVCVGLSGGDVGIDQDLVVHTIFIAYGDGLWIVVIWDRFIHMTVDGPGLAMTVALWPLWGATLPQGHWLSNATCRCPRPRQFSAGKQRTAGWTAMDCYGIDGRSISWFSS